MVNFFKAETVNSDILIDETMSIVTADENFEAISGNNALFVYTRYIHPDDVSRFTEALKDYAKTDAPLSWNVSSFRTPASRFRSMTSRRKKSRYV